MGRREDSHSQPDANPTAAVAASPQDHGPRKEKKKRGVISPWYAKMGRAALAAGADTADHV